MTSIGNVPMPSLFFGEAMPIIVSCPSCGAKMRAPDAVIGKKVKCPKCGNGIVIHAIAEISPEEPPLRRGPAVSRASPPASLVPLPAEGDLDTLGRRKPRTLLWVGLAVGALTLISVSAAVVLYARYALESRAIPVVEDIDFRDCHVGWRVVVVGEASTSSDGTVSVVTQLQGGLHNPQGLMLLISCKNKPATPVQGETMVTGTIYRKDFGKAGNTGIDVAMLFLDDCSFEPWKGSKLWWKEERERQQVEEEKQTKQLEAQQEKLEAERKAFEARRENEAEAAREAAFASAPPDRREEILSGIIENKMKAGNIAEAKKWIRRGIAAAQAGEGFKKEYWARFTDPATSKVILEVVEEELQRQEAEKAEAARKANEEHARREAKGRAEAKARAAEAKAYDALPAAEKDFVGKWRIVDRQGKTACYFTLTASHSASKSHVPDATGEWQVIKVAAKNIGSLGQREPGYAEARITWSDGFQDALRITQGSKTVRVLTRKPGTSWDDKPTSTARAIMEGK
jgi:hypothetical protein